MQERPVGKSRRGDFLFDEEDCALVEELRAQNTVVQCEESENHFKYGFSAGPIVQQEAAAGRSAKPPG